MYAVRHSYLLALGEFEGLDVYSSGTNTTLIWCFFLMATVISLLVLLNALIAIMSYTYAKVSERFQAVMMRERLQLIIENQFLPGPPNVHQINYLVNISNAHEHDDDDGNGYEALSNKIKKMKNQL